MYFDPFKHKKMAPSTGNQARFVSPTAILNEWVINKNVPLARSGNSITAVFWTLFLNVRGPAGNATLPQVRRKRSESHDPINSEQHLLMCLRCIFIWCVISSAHSHTRDVGCKLQFTVVLLKQCSETESETTISWLEQENCVLVIRYW